MNSRSCVPRRRRASIAASERRASGRGMLHRRQGEAIAAGGRPGRQALELKLVGIEAFMLDAPQVVAEGVQLEDREALQVDVNGEVERDMEGAGKQRRHPPGL